MRSAPIGAVLALALAESDNDLTESVARWGCAQANVRPDFAACAGWVRATVARLGVDVTGMRLTDTSGLSAGTAISVRGLVDLLARAADGTHPSMSEVVARFPVAGVSGTLADRFRRGPARAGAGLVRAKTGTLTGVSALGGTVVDRRGRLLVFAAVADRVPPGGTGAARVALDRLAATLSVCGCR